MSERVCWNSLQSDKFLNLLETDVEMFWQLCARVYFSVTGIRKIPIKIKRMRGLLGLEDEISDVSIICKLLFMETD